MISQGFLGNLGSIKSTPQSYVQAYSAPQRGHLLEALLLERDEAVVLVERALLLLHRAGGALLEVADELVQHLATWRQETIAQARSPSLRM